MPEFTWFCVIPTKSNQSLEIRVRSLAQVEDANATPAMQARGLFGPVKVAFKLVPEDGTGFLAVNTYREFLQIHRYARSYQKHLNDVIDHYWQSSSYRTTDITSAYKKIKDDLIPLAWVLNSIDRGCNMSGSAVWMENEFGNVVSMVAVPPRTATPRTPTPSPSPPPIPTRRHIVTPYASPQPTPPPVAIPSAPPQEFLYPELPSHILYPPPPSYGDVMGEQNIIARIKRSKICMIL